MQGIRSVFLFGKELIPIGQEKSPALNVHFAFACVWATSTEVCPPFLNLFDPKSGFFFVVSRGQVRRLLQFGDLLNRCKTKVESAELALPTVPCIDLSVPALCRAVQPCNGCHFASQWSTVAWRLRPHSRLNMKKTKVESASWCNRSMAGPRSSLHSTTLIQVPKRFTRRFQAEWVKWRLVRFWGPPKKKHTT